MFAVYLRNSPIAFPFTSLSYFSLNPRGHGHYISASSVYAAVQAQKQMQNFQKPENQI